MSGEEEEKKRISQVEIHCRERREKRELMGLFFLLLLFVGWKEMGGFGLIMVYKTEKMGDGCMSCPCDSRQIAIAWDLVSLDPFILFYFF
jgi:hypothetical protein